MIPYLYINDKFRRHIVCGDIHGCYNEFRRLLDTVEFSTDDLLITVGDMVGRGPFSREVALFFKNTPNAVAVMGNHERKMAGVIRGTMRPRWSQSQTLQYIPVHEQSGWADYFESLPAVLETEYCIVTHARLDPARPLTAQHPYFTCAVGGANVDFQRDSKGIPAWYREWKKKYPAHKPVCMGHNEYPAVRLVPDRLWALDTRAVYGKSLTAIIFPQQQIVSKKAEKNYRKIALSTLVLPDLDSTLPESWHLDTIAPFLQKENRLAKEQELVEIFFCYLAQTQLLQKLKSLRELLLEKHGAVPEPGNARGSYFKRLKNKIPKKVNSRLLSHLLSPRCGDLDTLMRIYQSDTLSKILKDMEILAQIKVD
ncbi:serine/threonine protein phosphatase [candidate division KSB1 bacterium]|nr:serine/threonine protein phosphatase [candidate division KSB1 bacterium]